MQKETETKEKNSLFCDIFIIGSISIGGGGPGPPSTGYASACAPPFQLSLIAFLKHYVATRQQTIMEKGIIKFKRNSRLKFSLFYAKLLATNCCT